MELIRKFFFILTFFLAGCVNQERPVLRVGNVCIPSTLDPQLAQGLAEGQVINALFEGLLISSPQSLEPLPGVAESYSISDDKREYTFFLRHDAVWSNGDPVVAQDFVNAVWRGLSVSLASPWIEQYFVLKNAKCYYDSEITDFSKVGIQAIDPATLKFILEEPVEYFLSLLTHWAWSPVNKKFIERFGNIFDRDNAWANLEDFPSNGPYVLSFIEIGNKIAVKKSKTYWDRDQVKIDTIHFISGVNPSTEENMFIARQLDITDNVPSDKIPIHSQNGTLKSSVSLGSSFYWINCNRPPFDNVNVRRALTLAIDRRVIGKLRNRGTGFEAYSLVPPGTLNYANNDLFQENIELAKKLLSDAGFPNGEGFPSVTLSYNSSDILKMLSEAVQEMWRKNLNINVELRSMEWGVFLNERRSHDFDICRGGWIGDFNDATTFLDLLKSDSKNNHAQWKNSEYDSNLDQALHCTDPKKRYELLAAAEKIMINEMPIIPLYFDSICHLVAPRVLGWYPNILDCHPWKFVSFAE